MFERTFCSQYMRFDRLIKQNEMTKYVLSGEGLKQCTVNLCRVNGGNMCFDHFRALQVKKNPIHPKKIWYNSRQKPTRPLSNFLFGNQ